MAHRRIKAFVTAISYMKELGKTPWLKTLHTFVQEWINNMRTYVEVLYLLVGYHSTRMLGKVCHQQSYLAVDPKYKSYSKK